MENPKLKKLTKKEKEEMRKEFEKPIDWSKAMRKGIYINLDPEIIEYFKDLSDETGRGYQSLIQEALLYFKNNKMKPRTVWESGKSKQD